MRSWYKEIEEFWPEITHFWGRYKPEPPPPPKKERGFVFTGKPTLKDYCLRVTQARLAQVEKEIFEGEYDEALYEELWELSRCVGDLPNISTEALVNSPPESLPLISFELNRSFWREGCPSHDESLGVKVFRLDDLLDFLEEFDFRWDDYREVLTTDGHQDTSFTNDAGVDFIGYLDCTTDLVFTSELSQKNLERILRWAEV